MRHGSRTASLLALLAAAGVGCSKRDLQAGGAPIGIDAGARDGAGATGGGTGTGGATGSGGAADVDARVPGATDAAESACVITAIPLPWMKPSSAINRLDVVTAGDAVAVLNRQPDLLDVRTYGRDGAVLGGFQFAADAQFLPHRDGRFLLVTRGVTGGFSATAIDPDLVGGARLYGAAATVTEHVRGGLPLAASTIIITDERFVNVADDRGVPWSSVLGAADANTFQAGRLYGLASDGDRVLIAWGMNDTLRLAVLDTSGALLARAEHAAFFDPVGSYTASAIPREAGLLLFDRNPVRLTQIGFDLSLTELGTNDQLRTFDRTAPRVAAIELRGQPVAFWLTVFPNADSTQGVTPHQLYACELGLAAPSTCQATAPIAHTGLGGYGIAEEPVAAAGFADGVTFAVAHTDVSGRSWLRIANLDCASRSAEP